MKFAEVKGGDRIQSGSGAEMLIKLGERLFLDNGTLVNAIISESAEPVCIDDAAEVTVFK